MKPLGSETCNGMTVDRVLRVSTAHMPDLSQDLSPWHWGEYEPFGLTWIWAYEEDCFIGDEAIPEWLLNICLAARDKYNCNWVLLDPDAEAIPDLPTYDHP